MKLVVTGASGFIGRSLLEQLERAGHYGTATARRRFVVPQPWLWQNREEMLSGSEGVGQPPDALLHLEVKQHMPRRSRADLAAFREVNVAGTQRWLEWCSARSIHRFVYFSTSKAVQGESYHNRNGGTDESAPGPGESPYGQSKWEAEELVRRWAQEKSQRSALILRPAVVYGPGNSANMFSMVDALAKRRFLLVGANQNIKSLVSLKNLCAAVTHLLPEVPCGVHTYNIVDAQSYGMREVAQMITNQLQLNWTNRSLPIPLAKGIALFGDSFAKLTGRDFPLTTNRLMALLEHNHFSCAKLLASGFRHPQTTEEGLREMIEWYRGQAQPTVR